MTDEVLEEVQRARLAYAERFGFDLEAMCRDLREKARLGGRVVLTLPPKRLGLPADDEDAAEGERGVELAPQPSAPPESVALPG